MIRSTAAALRDYTVCLDAERVICCRRTVDEAADHIDALEAEVGKLRSILGLGTALGMEPPK